MDADKIDQKLDKVAAGNTMIDMDLGGVRFQSMMEIMEFSKLMALSQLAVPVHLRNNPGACLAVCTKALRFGFDPFALAEHSFSMVKNVKEGNEWFKVETIAYDSAVIRAVINARAPVKEPITYRFEGEGPDRVCIAIAKPIRGEVIEWRSAKLGDKLAAMKRNDKGEIKGSPLWESPKSDVQFAYDTGRDLCRIYFPETLMGWYDKDEFDEAAKAERAKDVTPRPAIAEKLKGNKGAGFNAAHVAREADAQEAKPSQAARTKKEPEVATIIANAADDEAKHSAQPPATIQQIFDGMFAEISAFTNVGKLREWAEAKKAEIEILPDDMVQDLKALIEAKDRELDEF